MIIWEDQCSCLDDYLGRSKRKLGNKFKLKSSPLLITKLLVMVSNDRLFLLWKIELAQIYLK